MATLTQATEITRTVAKWAAIAIAAFIIIRFILFPLGKVVYNMIFPKAPDAPTVAFGKLPQIQFPQSTITNTFTYAIQTTTGALPTAADRMKVYPVIAGQKGFALLDAASQKVSTLGFKDEGNIISPTLHSWTNSDTQAQIIFDLTTNAFDYTLPIASDSSDIEDPAPNKQAATTIAKNFLNRLELLPADLDDTKTQATFLTIVNGNLLPASSLSESDYTQVDFYRKSLDDIPFESAFSNRSAISFLIQTLAAGDAKVIQAHYSHKSIDSKNAATYPIKTTQIAFDELKAGKGYIVSGPTGGQTTINIQKLHFAYYDDINNTAYLMPVFVFEGDGNFKAYISATQDQWVE